LNLGGDIQVLETDNSTPSNADIKNVWSYNPAPSILGAKGKLYFLLYLLTAV
jgi:hypothetical protein